MADNYAATPGSGLDFSADNIGGVLHPRIKISVGADGEAADLDHGQAAMAASLPVVIASNQSSVPVTPASLSTALAAAAVTVGTAQAALPASALANRRTIMIYNNGAATIYVGPTGVTTSSGLPIPAGQALSFDLVAGVVLYGISGSSGQNVRVLEAS